MTTIGYGDISAKNEYEAILLILGMLTATLIFSIAFNTVGEMIKDINNEKNKMYHQISTANIYLKRKNATS